MAQKHTRKLTRSSSHSYYVLIPPQILRDLKWSKGQKLTVEKGRKTLIIRDWKPKRKS